MFYHTMVKQEEVKREVLFIVLLLIIFISLVGTWTVLKLTDEPLKKEAQEFQPGGMVALTIESLEEETNDVGVGDDGDK